MNIYERKPISNVLLNERLISELRNLQIKINELETTVNFELLKIKKIIEKQNCNSMNLENLRNVIGHSRSAVITFIKPGDKKIVRPGLVFKNHNEKYKKDSDFNKYKNNTLMSKNSRCLIEDCKRNVNVTELRRTLSDSRKYTFDFIRDDQVKVTHLTLLIYRLEHVITKEIVNVTRMINKLQQECTGGIIIIF